MRPPGTLFAGEAGCLCREPGGVGGAEAAARARRRSGAPPATASGRSPRDGKGEGNADAGSAFDGGYVELLATYGLNYIYITAILGLVVLGLAIVFGLLGVMNMATGSS